MWLEAFDTNKDGCISWEEFKQTLVLLEETYVIEEKEEDADSPADMYAS
jgi:hypothetical protein